MPQAIQTVEEPVADNLRKKKSKPRRNFAGEQVGSGEGTSTQVSSTEDISKKRKIVIPSAANRSATGFEQQQELKQSTAQDEDGSLSNKEFAKQFTQARSGNPMALATGKPGLSKKDRRANKNVLPAKRKADDNKLDTPNTLTDASSMTGADGDDDFSPVGSPPLGASWAKVNKAGDVSDMLEAPSAGPAVLRLTDPKGTLNKVQPKPAAKPFEAAETKKQRQARQKREAAKAANEEAEIERRKLMEKQIRGARMAEGTSAQSKTASFKAPTENAWFANNNGGVQAPAQQPSVPYIQELDVREPVVEPDTQGNGAVSVKPLSNVTSQRTRDESVNSMKKMLGIGQTEALGASSRKNGKNGAYELNAATNILAAEPASSEQSKTPSWADDMISEEEQLRIALEEEDSWRTVSTKKEKRKGGKASESKDVSTTSEASVEHSRVNGSAQRPSTNDALRRNESSNRYAIVDQDDGTWEA
jgi:type II secretory pathway pseudopilin PulG